MTVLYVHHFADHAKAWKLPYKLMVKTGPGDFKTTWVDPASGKTIRTEQVSTKQIYAEIAMPPTKIDVACRLERIE